MFQGHIESEEDEDDEIKPLFSEEEVEVEVDERTKGGTAEEKAERLKREAEEKKREEKELEWRSRKRRSVIDSVRVFDPKSKSIVWVRFPFEDLSEFDLDEESNIPPMRHTGMNYEGCNMYWSANILSVKIMSSDVGFPLDVYGTDDSLILIGPSRGFLLKDFIFLEVDLKIKHEQGKFRQLLSKGLLQNDGRVVTRQEIEVKSVSHASWFSTVKVEYTAVKTAVEATVEFQAFQGNFCGEIAAHTSSIINRIVLHDSNNAGDMATCDASGIIHLRRRVIAVCLNEMLIFTIVTRLDTAATAASTRMIQFVPSLNGANEHVIHCGAVKLRVKVTWSVIDRFY
ncbi:hypothetical protein PR202_ga18856 [Eleusine coracana subsp. coracana]|uniref:DUF6598 domain-containing protein n=1 Tax=Eleusine coracana subsp. coracana TaxID=191504 RepID=A0AAV5CU10_ELECO|nr:hypothetical protein PR202_ga18856 [Eleusine coracana subsp. coracana]